MTILEMHDQIKVLRDLYKAPYYDGAELDVFINSAISAFVLSKIPDPIKGAKFNVESQKTWDQLGSLIETQTVTVFTTAGVKDILYLASCSFSKNADFSFYYSSTCLVSAKSASISVVNYNEISNLSDDVFNGPNDTEVKICFFQNKVFIISLTVPDKFLLHYVKNPTIVSLENSINCNLPISTHDKICHMATALSCGGSNLKDLYSIEENEIGKR